jgi:hypothetical protein
VKLYKISSKIESVLIRFGLFKSALFFRQTINFCIVLSANIRSQVFMSQRSIRSVFAEFELDNITFDLVKSSHNSTRRKKTDFKLGNFLVSMQLWEMPNYLDSYKTSSILIVGPGLGEIPEYENYTLIIFLNTDLDEEKFDKNVDYMIVFNKQTTINKFHILTELCAYPRIVSIFTKEKKYDFSNYNKIHPITISDFYELVGSASGPNLLTIGLILSAKFSPRSIEVVGCDLYLGDITYRSTTKLNKILANTKMRAYFLNTLTYHNPYAQLSFIKVLDSYFSYRGIELKTHLKVLSYVQIANKFKAKLRKMV